MNLESKMKEKADLHNQFGNKRWNCIPLRNAIAIAKEYAEEMNKTCYWRWNNETDDDYYDTECKHTFIFSVGVLEDNETFNYCPFCSGKIAEVE